MRGYFSYPGREGAEEDAARLVLLLPTEEEEEEEEEADGATLRMRASAREF